MKNFTFVAKALARISLLHNKFTGDFSPVNSTCLVSPSEPLFQFEKVFDESDKSSWQDCPVHYQDVQFNLKPETGFQMETGGRILPLSATTFNYVTSDGRIISLEAYAPKESLNDLILQLEMLPVPVSVENKLEANSEKQRRFSV